MAFSGAVKLGDLNDFIAPSQACVVNLAPKGKLAAVDLQVDTVQLPNPLNSTGGFQQTQLAGDAVKVSLQDCLACSGCVTSAETVLLEHQSTEELLSALSSGKAVIMSVSPQSRASLAAFHNMSATKTLGKLVSLFKGLGVKAVLDTSTSRDLSLLESAQEFIARYLTKHPEHAGTGHGESLVEVQSQLEEQASSMDAHQADRLSSHVQASTSNRSTAAAQSHLHPHSNGNAPSPKVEFRYNYTSIYGPSPAASGHDRQNHAAQHQQTATVTPVPKSSSNRFGGLGHPAEHSAHQDRSNGATELGQYAGPLPMLASACPGWVCYAEKTHGSYILPYISTAKSPQAVMGTLVKRFVSKQLGLEPSQIYHCAVMPCYDKKLESSRDDFFLPGTTIPEVDSVLTTAEVQQLIEQQGADLQQLPCSPVDPVLSGTGGEDGKLYGIHGGAGGYLEFIFRTAAHQLFHRQLPPGPLQLKTLRNADFKEITLNIEGCTVLRFAAAYGFRNIQTLVRKIKRQACEYDYVEVMACPSACLNGGGQIKARKGQTVQQLLNELDESYHAPDVSERHPADNPLVPFVYKHLIGNGQFSPAAKELLHTGYHHREKSVTASIGDW